MPYHWVTVLASIKPLGQPHHAYGLFFITWISTGNQASRYAKLIGSAPKLECNLFYANAYNPVLSLWGLTSKCIHEGGEGTRNHLEERVPHGVPLGATQCGVFQDVSHPSAVHGGGTEPHAEGGREEDVVNAHSA